MRRLHPTITPNTTEFVKPSCTTRILMAPRNKATSKPRCEIVYQTAIRISHFTKVPPDAPAGSHGRHESQLLLDHSHFRSTAKHVWKQSMVLQISRLQEPTGDSVLPSFRSPFPEHFTSRCAPLLTGRFPFLEDQMHNQALASVRLLARFTIEDDFIENR